MKSKAPANKRYHTRSENRPTEAKEKAPKRAALGEVTNIATSNATKPNQIKKPLVGASKRPASKSRVPTTKSSHTSSLPAKRTSPRLSPQNDDAPPSSRTRHSLSAMEVDLVETPTSIPAELLLRFPAVPARLLEAVALNIAEHEAEHKEPPTCGRHFNLHGRLSRLQRNLDLYDLYMDEVPLASQAEITHLLFGTAIDEARHIANPDVAQLGELQMCAEYVNDVFRYYKARESAFAIESYLPTKQPHVGEQMRSILIDWMVEVQENFELNHETLYQAVKLVDLYLARGPRVAREKLQLVGSAALFIACKFDERIPPLLDDFVYICDYAYNKDEFIKMETKVLEIVKFDIGFPLSYRFLRRYSRLNADSMGSLTLARFILEASLVDYEFCFEPESKMAAGALLLAHLMLNHQSYTKSVKEASEADRPAEAAKQWDADSTVWSTLLTYHSGYTRRELTPLVRRLTRLVSRATGFVANAPAAAVQPPPAAHYRTVLHKYSHEVFYSVAKTPCLLETDIV